MLVFPAKCLQDLSVWEQWLPSKWPYQWRIWSHFYFQLRQEFSGIKISLYSWNKLIFQVVVSLYNFWIEDSVFVNSCVLHDHVLVPLHLGDTKFGPKTEKCWYNLSLIKYVVSVGHVLNEQGTGCKCVESIGFDWVKKWTLPHEKEHQTLIQIVKFECNWREEKSIVGL